MLFILILIYYKPKEKLKKNAGTVLVVDVFQNITVVIKCESLKQLTISEKY